jgi:myo-inositol-1(or 4)-monophosphatase
MSRGDVDLAALLALAERAARAAGDLLLDRPETLSVDTKSSPTDVVTQMDRAAERLLVDLLLGERPDDGVLGEEGAGIEGSSGLRWVLDPLDGTVNYLYRLPGWAVCVAAEVDGIPVVGVVHAPALDSTWVAARGGGAWRGGHPIRTGECRDLAAALVGTGFGYSAQRRAQQADVVRNVLPRVRDIRRAGAASIDLCHVADGRLDAYYERGLQRWDHAAAGVVATEAGAALRIGAGDDPQGTPVLAANPALMGRLADLLAEAGDPGYRDAPAG